MAGINSTKSQANKTADEHLDKKLELEENLVRDLNLYFEQLAEDFKVVYGATGKVLTLTESYEEELSSLLKKNYRMVANDFSDLTQRALADEIDLDLYQPIPEEESKLKEKIAIAVGAYILLRAKKITPKIAQTTQDVLLNLTDDYIVNQARAGLAVTNAEIANNVSQKVKEWGLAHATTVATTEVQTLAEKAKNIENIQVKENIKNEVERIAKGGAVIKGKKPEELTKADLKDAKEITAIASTVDVQKGSRKVWITSGDEKVRKSHSILDGKTIDQDDYFVTGMGSRMLYSGDMENGASLSDVINCRCVVVYKYNTEIVKIYRNSIFRRKI